MSFMLKSSGSPTFNPSAEKSLYHKTILNNGIRIVTETIPYVRSVSVGVWANVGSRDEKPDQNGITHFLEHMVFKGTKKRSIREIARSVESRGGYLNAFTTKENTCFYARILDTNLAQTLDVLSDLVRNATFNHEEMEKEKLVVLEELKSSEDDPEDVVHEYFERALFPNHSLGLPIIGCERNLMSFQRSHLRTHVVSHYSSSNIVIAAAGNVDHSKLVNLTEKFFSGMSQNGGAQERKAPLSSDDRPKKTDQTKKIHQAHICLGRRAYSAKHKHRYPLLLLNTLLGEGMSSRLYQSVRERHGLAYSIYSFVNMLSDTGVFGTYVATDENNVANAIDLIFIELGKLRSKSVSKAELDRTKSQIKGTMMLGLENMSGRMMRLGTSEMVFEKYVPIQMVLDNIDRVTVENIHHVAKELFVEDQFSTVIIRPS